MTPHPTDDSTSPLDGAWETRADLAAEVSVLRGEKVSIKRIYGWKKQGAPIPRNGPIPKAPLMEWLVGLSEPGFQPQDRSHEEEELRRQLLVEQVRNLTAKNEVLEGSRIDAGVVSRGLLAACASLKTILDGDLPIRFVEAIRSLSVEAAVDEIRRMQREAVNRFCAECHENVGAKIVPEE